MQHRIICRHAKTIIEADAGRSQGQGRAVCYQPSHRNFTTDHLSHRPRRIERQHRFVGGHRALLCGGRQAPFYCEGAKFTRGRNPPFLRITGKSIRSAFEWPERSGREPDGQNNDYHRMQGGLEWVAPIRRTDPQRWLPHADRATKLFSAGRKRSQP